MIAFIGNVFSPYYRLARRAGATDPHNHACLNVALSGRSTRWSMTERPARMLHRERDTIAIGPSRIRRQGDSLRVTIRERECPLPRAIVGEITIHPLALTDAAFAIDQTGRHRWRPIAPACRIEVALDRPALRWTGRGYLDSNDGDAPLEADFSRWSWCRIPLPSGRTVIFYDTEPRLGSSRSLSLQVGRAGEVTEADAPPFRRLPRSRWRIGRDIRSEAPATVRRTLLDAPFYARSVVDTVIEGAPALAMHESVDLDRFVAWPTQLMLPFRMPRAWS